MPRHRLRQSFLSNRATVADAMAAHPDNAVVIGGGLGGLSAAIHLATAGHRVTLLEKNELPGGKANHYAWNGFQFDTGPSLLTLPFVLDGIFKSAGKRMEDYLELTRVRPACRYFFDDGLRFDAPGDLDNMRAGIAQNFPSELDGFDRFMRDGKRLWEVSGPAFLFNRMELATLLKIPPLKGLAGLGALKKETLGQSVKRYFRDPHLIQLFSRYATYNGSDPARTPATFNVISYVEMAFGSWHVQGGIYAMVRALEGLAIELGVEVRTQNPVERIEFAKDGKAVSGVVLDGGERLHAEKIVVNADAVTALCGPLMQAHPKADKWREKWSRPEVSGSGYVLLLAMDKSFPGLTCHNIFFNADYAHEFRDIFEQPKPLADPTVYISVPCKIDASQAPAGKEAWFVLVNAPSLDRCTDWPERYSDFLLDKIKSRLEDFSTTDVLHQKALTPRFLQERYAAWQGSIYGPSSNTLRSAFFRVPNRGPVRGLAFAGGSAHPGGGIPLALTSGRLAAEVV